MHYAAAGNLTLNRSHTLLAVGINEAVCITTAFPLLRYSWRHYSTQPILPLLPAPPNHVPDDAPHHPRLATNQPALSPWPGRWCVPQARLRAVPRAAPAPPAPAAPHPPVAAASKACFRVSFAIVVPVAVSATETASTEAAGWAAACPSADLKGRAC
jgi:hypothetical protein